MLVYQRVNCWTIFWSTIVSFFRISPEYIGYPVVREWFQAMSLHIPNYLEAKQLAFAYISW